MKNSQGLGVLELFIASFVLLAILALISLGMFTSSHAVGKVITEAELIEDIRVAGQMIANGVGNAVYVYPPGANIMLNSAGSWTVENPNSLADPRVSANEWRVGVDPILAYIERPKNPRLKCGKTFFIVEGAAKAGCLYFVAYYAILRSTLSEHRPYLFQEHNQDAWVLFEYRKRLDIEKLTLANVLPPTKPEEGLKGVGGKILSDYLRADTGFEVHKQVCRNHLKENGEGICKVFSQAYEAYHLDTLLRAELALQAEFRTHKARQTTPWMSFAVAPKNLY